MYIDMTIKTWTMMPRKTRTQPLTRTWNWGCTWTQTWMAGHVPGAGCVLRGDPAHSYTEGSLIIALGEMEYTIIKVITFRSDNNYPINNYQKR
jgi:hypothetical protein